MQACFCVQLCLYNGRCRGIRPCNRGGGLSCAGFRPFFAISHFPRNFPQFSAIVFTCPPCVLIGALCVPCADVLLLEASGGLVAAPQFFRNIPAIFRISPPAIARNFSHLDLTAVPPPPRFALQSCRPGSPGWGLGPGPSVPPLIGHGLAGSPDDAARFSWSAGAQCGRPSLLCGHSCGGCGGGPLIPENTISLRAFVSRGTLSHDKRPQGDQKFALRGRGTREPQDGGGGG